MTVTTLAVFFFCNCHQLPVKSVDCNEWPRSKRQSDSDGSQHVVIFQVDTAGGLRSGFLRISSYNIC